MNLIKQFTNSLWNFRSYRWLSQIKGGKSFLYIFLLFLLIYLIGSIYSGAQLSYVIDYIQASLEEGTPNFQLSEGRFTFDGEMPYRIEEDDFLIIIDTTGQSTQDDITNVPSGILITEDELITSSMGIADVTPFSLFGPLEISKNMIIEALPGLKALFVIIMVIGFLFAFAGKLFGILMLTLIAFFPASLFRKQLTFQNKWNVAIYASTMPMLIKLVNTILGSPISSMFLIYWAVAITYVFLGIYQMNHSTSPMEPVLETDNPNPEPNS